MQILKFALAAKREPVPEIPPLELADVVADIAKAIDPQAYRMCLASRQQLATLGALRVLDTLARYEHAVTNPETLRRSWFKGFKAKGDANA